MPRNGSGTYALPAGQPVVTGTVISSSVFNTLTADLATEMTNSTDKDGQTVVTADWDFNGNAIIMDTDGDSKIDMPTDDQWDLTLGGVLELSLTAAKADNLDDISALAVTNSNFIVGDGADWVAESGDTARISLGVGSTDSPTFAGLALTADLTVPNGGTGASTFTDGAVLLGSGTGAITALDVTAKGSILAGDGTTDPVALAVGADGLVLEAASGEASGLKWGSKSSASMVFISAATASSDATIEFTGIDSTYDEYEIHLLNVIPATDIVSLYFRTSTDGGSTFDSGVSDYAYGNLYGAGATPTAATDTAAAFILLCPSVGSAANEAGVSGVLRLVRPSEATYTSAWMTGYFVDSSARPSPFTSCGNRSAAEDVDAIQFLFNTGNVESGLFALYGVKRS